MLSFNNDPSYKDNVLDVVRWHEEQDRIVQGIYWDTEGKKGCAVGCTLRSIDIVTNGLWPEVDLTFGEADKYSIHEDYQRLLAVPTIIAYYEELVFEAAPSSYAHTWPRRFIEAIPVGADLSGFSRSLAITMLSDENSPYLTYHPELRRALLRFVRDSCATSFSTEPNIPREKLNQRERNFVDWVRNAAYNPDGYQHIPNITERATYVGEAMLKTLQRYEGVAP